MACGTGKTFVCLWVKEKLKAKRTLVLVPSLGLLSQILNDWTFAACERFDALCVCSDQTVNRKDEDEPISLVADLAFPVSNDVAEIAHFLRRDNDQVIFSTYQSSPLIAHAQKNADVPHFDLARSVTITNVATQTATSVSGQSTNMQPMHSGIWQSLTRNPRLNRQPFGDPLRRASAVTGRPESSFDTRRLEFNPSRSF
jgi:predicted helicase